MPLPRPARPSALIADLRNFFAGNQRHKLLIAVVAILMPVLIVWMFVRDGRDGISPGIRIIYVQSWPASRSDAEIIAQQKIDQKIRERQQAEKRAAYQRLEKQLGM